MMRWVNRWNAMKTGCWGDRLLTTHSLPLPSATAKSYLGGDDPDVPEAAEIQVQPYQRLSRVGFTCQRN